MPFTGKGLRETTAKMEAARLQLEPKWLRKVSCVEPTRRLSLSRSPSLSIALSPSLYPSLAPSRSLSLDPCLAPSLDLSPHLSPSLSLYLSLSLAASIMDRIDHGPIIFPRIDGLDIAICDGSIVDR